MGRGGFVNIAAGWLRMSPDDDDDDYEMQEEDDEEEEPEEEEYEKMAPSEFRESDVDPDDDDSLSVNATLLDPRRSSQSLGTTSVDWGGALSVLRNRASDVESGRGSEPPVALFRTVTREKPNEAVGRFVREGNPEVVAAMTGAVSALLGTLSDPSGGI